MRFVPAFIVDAVLVLVFAVIGRASHGESPGGFLITAWPFIVALLVGHVVAALLPARPRRPWSLGWGAVVWLVTVAGDSCCGSQRETPLRSRSSSSRHSCSESSSSAGAPRRSSAGAPGARATAVRHPNTPTTRIRSMESCTTRSPNTRFRSRTGHRQSQRAGPIPRRELNRADGGLARCEGCGVDLAPASVLPDVIPTSQRVDAVSVTSGRRASCQPRSRDVSSRRDNGRRTSASTARTTWRVTGAGAGT